MNAVGTIINFR